MGLFAALLTTFCWSLGIFPFTEAARRFGTAALNQYRLLLAWIFITIIACAWYRISPVQLAATASLHNYFFLGLSGIVGFTVGDFCAFNSFKMLGPKLGSLYTTIAPCAALILGVVVLGETINFIGILGVIITIGGVVWLTLSRKDKAEAESHGFKRNTKGILFGITGALCQGCGLVLSKVGFITPGQPGVIPTLQAVWIRLLFAFVAAMMVSAAARSFVRNTKTVFSNQDNGMLYMVAGTILGPVTGVSLSLVAITHLRVAEAQTIFALLPVIVLPLNYFFYRERITLPSVLACFTAVCGVFVLIWRDIIITWIL